MLPSPLSIRSTALVRTRYADLAQLVLHDAEEMALADQRSDPSADEVLVSLLLIAPHDPLLADLFTRLSINQIGLAEVIGARVERRNESEEAAQERSDAYHAWIRITAMTAPVDLRVMLGSLLISTWLSAISRVVIEQAGITHERLVEDLERHPSGDSVYLAALLGVDPAGPPLGRLVSADEASMAIGRSGIVRTASAYFRDGISATLSGRRGVGKAVLARAAGAASGRLTIEVPMAVIAHLKPAELDERWAALSAYLLERDGGLLVTDADKRIDAQLAELSADIPILVTMTTGVRLPRFARLRAARRINVPEPGPDVAWHVVKAWSEREGLKWRFDPAALPAAVSLAHRFLDAGDTALPGSAIDLVRHARPVREDGVIDEAAIEAAVTMTTGLPAVIVSEHERAKLNDLSSLLTGRIVGQLAAIGATVKVVRRRAVRLGREKNRPLGIFIFLGPTGVGKTELARAIAEIVYGSENALLKFNMGDYQERHELAKLLGSPPGYVGSEEEGEISTGVRARPDGGVLLLDEYEKAHQNVSNLMLGVFDDGTFKGNKGQPVELTNWIIIMTSNLGSDAKGNLGFSAAQSTQALDPRQAGRAKAVREHWRPEFLNRVHAVVHFDPLSIEQLDAILGLRLESFRADLAGFRLAFRMGPRMRRKLAIQAFESGFGGREMILRRFPEEVEDRFADLLLDSDYVAGACYVLELDDHDIPVMTCLLPGQRGYEPPWTLAPRPAVRHAPAIPKPAPVASGRVMRV